MHGALSAAEHKTVNRIESFSDIVFGFSLFTLAVNLKVPATSQDLIAQIPQFVVFAATFGLLCALWWTHHELMRDFFKPDHAGVILNFALLGAVALFSYPLQLFFRFGWQDPVTIAGYAGAAFLVFGLIAAIVVKGILQLASALSQERKVFGIGIAARTAAVALTMVIALFMFPQGSAAMLWTICVGAAIVDGIIVPIARRAVRRASAGAG